MIKTLEIKTFSNKMITTLLFITAIIFAVRIAANNIFASDKQTDVEKAYITATTITRDKMKKDSNGGWSYNGIDFVTEDCNWLNSPLNKEGSINQGAFYRKMAYLIEGTQMFGSYKDVAKRVLGFVPDNLDEWNKYYEDLSSYIIIEAGLPSLSKIFQRLNDTICADAYIDNENERYALWIKDLEGCAKELNITQEMLGWILADIDEYTGNASFNGNTYTVYLGDVDLNDVFPEFEAGGYTDKETVSKVQEQLNALGFNCGEVDGVAGEKTHSAIIRFKKSQGFDETGYAITDEFLESLYSSRDDTVDSNKMFPDNDFVNNADALIDYIISCYKKDRLEADIIKYDYDYLNNSISYYFVGGKDEYGHRNEFIIKVLSDEIQKNIKSITLYNKDSNTIQDYVDVHAIIIAYYFDDSIDKPYTVIPMEKEDSFVDEEENLILNKYKNGRTTYVDIVFKTDVNKLISYEPDSSIKKEENDKEKKLKQTKEKVAKKPQTMKVKANRISINVDKLQKSDYSISKFKAFDISDEKGIVTFSKIDGSKCLDISRYGRIKVAEKTPVGRYMISVLVEAKGNTEYESGSKTVNVIVNVEQSKNVKTNSSSASDEKAENTESVIENDGKNIILDKNLDDYIEDTFYIRGSKKLHVIYEIGNPNEVPIEIDAKFTSNKDDGTIIDTASDGLYFLEPEKYNFVYFSTSLDADNASIDITPRISSGKKADLSYTVDDSIINGLDVKVSNMGDRDSKHTNVTAVFLKRKEIVAFISGFEGNKWKTLKPGESYTVKIRNKDFDKYYVYVSGVYY